jgi:hypothetical protein
MTKIHKKRCNKCKNKIEKIFRSVLVCKKCSILFCRGCLYHVTHNCPGSHEFEKEYKRKLINQLVDANFEKVIKI